MLGNTKGKLINQYVPDYVLYDLETTGTSSKYDEVIEISAVKVKNGVVTEEFSQLVNPGRPIPSAASAVIISRMIWWRLHQCLIPYCSNFLLLSEMMCWQDIISIVLI